MEFFLTRNFTRFRYGHKLQTPDLLLLPYIQVAYSFPSSVQGKGNYFLLVLKHFFQIVGQDFSSLVPFRNNIQIFSGVSVIVLVRFPIGLFFFPSPLEEG